MHRRNKAERAIRTWKNHFIATLAGVDPDFPMCAWNELIKQAEITVNLLRESPTNPRASAWECMNGPYDFDAHPMAPPGTAITIHEKPGQRKSWSKHGVKGFYLGPAMQHYRCYDVWTTQTGNTRTTDTVAWHPKGYQWEQYSPLEMVTSTAEVLSNALHHLAQSDTTLAAHRQPIDNISHDILSNFEALKAIFDMPPSCDSHAIQRVVGDKTTDLPTIQRVPAKGKDNAQPVPQDREPFHPVHPTRKSARRKHKWLNHEDSPPQKLSALAVQEATMHDPHLTYNERKALMIMERTAGIKKRQKKRPLTCPDEEITWGASPYQHTCRQAVRHARKLIKKHASWTEWANTFPDIELDSNGVPFFLDTPQRASHLANTAIDLDDKGKKLSMTTALAGEDGHL